MWPWAAEIDAYPSSLPHLLGCEALLALDCPQWDFVMDHWLSLVSGVIGLPRLTGLDDALPVSTRRALGSTWRTMVVIHNNPLF